jgi:hypothetical protein
MPRSLVSGRRGFGIPTGLFPALFLAAVIARILMIWLLPPLLDVYYYDEQSGRALLNGIDPYGLSYVGIPSWLSTPNASNVFAYLPGVVLFLAPFGAVWDVRLGLVFADVLVGYSIYSLGGSKSTTAALLFILLPFTALFSTSYPNNTLVAMAFLGLAGALWARGKGRVASVMLGIALASSQLLWLLYPIFLVWSLRSRKFDQVAIQVVVALALTLPFALWNLPSFTYDTLVFQFTRAPRAVVSAAAFGINVNPTLDGIAYTLLGQSVPLLVRAALTLAGVSFAVLKSRDLRSVLLNASWLMVLATFVLPNDLSWWYLELPFMTFLMWLSAAEVGSGASALNA